MAELLVARRPGGVCVEAIPGDERWDAAYDVSEPCDEIIDLLDISAFVEHWLSPPQ